MTFFSLFLLKYVINMFQISFQYFDWITKQFCHRQTGPLAVLPKEIKNINFFFHFAPFWSSANSYLDKTLFSYCPNILIRSYYCEYFSDIFEWVKALTFYNIQPHFKWRHTNMYILILKTICWHKYRSPTLRRRISNVYCI